MLENLLMPPHPLRQRLCSHIVQRTHHASIVQNLQCGLTDELFDVDLNSRRADAALIWDVHVRGGENICSGGCVRSHARRGVGPFEVGGRTNRQVSINTIAKSRTLSKILISLQLHMHSNHTHSKNTKHHGTRKVLTYCGLCAAMTSIL